MELDPTTSRTIERSKLKAVGLPLVSLVLTACSVFVIWLPTDQSGTVFVGSVGTVVFGLCCALFSYRLFFGETALVTLSSDGLVETRLSSQEIPWRQIDRVVVDNVRGRRFLHFHLVDYTVPPRSDVVARLVGGPTDLSEISVPADDLSLSATDYVALLRAYLAAHNPDARLEDVQPPGQTVANTK